MKSIWKLNITVFLTALLFTLTGNSYAGNVEVKLPTNSAFQVISGVQPLMHVGSNGKIGIGTTSPGAILHVRKDTATVGASDIKLENKNNQGAARYVLANDGGDKGVLQAVGSAYTVFTNIKDDIELVRLDAGDMNIVFDVSAGSKFNIMGQSRSEKVTVDINNGNVGIGTTTPGRKLTIYDPLASTWNSGIGLEREGGYDSRINVSADGLMFRNFNSTGTTPAFSFRDVNDNHLVEILGNGNVGIGTTTPASLLEIANAQGGKASFNLNNSTFAECNYA